MKRSLPRPTLEANGRAGCVPTLERERILWEQGIEFVAGLDEVGCGPLAGPLMAAAVVLPKGASWTWLAEVRDSKLLSAKRREILATAIHAHALGIGVGAVGPTELAKIGVPAARRRAMTLALGRLAVRAQHLIIDAFPLPDVRIAQTPLIRADAICTSVACASIVAKVARDRIMVGLDQRYPGYGFGRHMGYPTPLHLAALEQLGVCPIHRQSFGPVRRLLGP
jgi:ribonuclease HII